MLAWIAVATAARRAVLLSRMRFWQLRQLAFGAQEESVRRAGVKHPADRKMITLDADRAGRRRAGILTAARLGSGRRTPGRLRADRDRGRRAWAAPTCSAGRGTGGRHHHRRRVITGVIANGLTLLGVSPFLAPIVTGLVLVAAIWVQPAWPLARGPVRPPGGPPVTDTPVVNTVNPGQHRHRAGVQ